MRIEIAYALAKHAHRWQERKEVDGEGRPIRYFEHLRATALILIDELECHDPDMIVACLMHDAIEDTNDISAAMLEHIFGTRVARMVTMLTKNPKSGYYDRLQQYADIDTLVVKACDRISNLRTLNSCDPAFREKQIKETMEVLLPVLQNPNCGRTPRLGDAIFLLLREFERNNWPIT
jgi:(p)ppGpp synthase/HD superfamily hydrolase